MKKQKRRSRYERQDNPKEIHIQPRDIHILQAVYIHRILRQDQIARLFFGSKERAQKRLVKLYDHGLLDRLFLPVQLGRGGRSPTFYVLDRKGADLLRETCPQMNVTWHHSYKSVTETYIRHASGINEIMVMIHLGCHHNHLRIVSWMTEAQLKADYDYVNITPDAGKRKRVSLIPDTYFEIAIDKRVYPFFVEYDRGTMDSKAIRDKLRAYIAFGKSIGDRPSLFEQRFGRKGFRVLFVTQTGKRKHNLLDAIQKVGDNHRFWFAALPELSAKNILTHPIWHHAGATEKQILIQRG